MKSVVLLSAGLDSTVNLYQALQDSEVACVITFNYGQRAARKEIEKATLLCQLNQINHKVIDLHWFKTMSTSSLTDDTKNIPTGQSVAIDDFQVSTESAKSVWVPNRNGIFLNIAAGFAESLQADVVIPGFNLEEALTFPDNSQSFMSALDNSFYYSTANKVKVKCFTVFNKKNEIVKKGLQLGVPFEHIWPCYFDGETWCGQCESCLRSKRAFEQNGLEFKEGGK